MIKIVHKRSFTIALVFIIVLLCGCDKINYNSEEKTDDVIYTTDDAGIAAALNVPSSCNMKIDTEDSDLPEIFISDDDVSVPSTDKMALYYYNIKKSDKTYRQKIIDAVFEDSSKIYIYDFDNPSKEEILIEKEYYQLCLDLAKEKGDEGGIQTYQSYVDDCNNKYDKADKGVILNGDFVSNSYIGKIDDSWYVLSFNEDLDENCQGFRLSAFPEGSLIYRREKDGICGAYVGNTSGDSIEQELENVQNISNINPEDAEEIAASFLEQCGITDMAVYEIGNLEWNYTNTFFDDMDYIVEYDGYYIIFERSLDEVLPYTFDSSEIDNIDTDEYYQNNIETEYFTIYVDEYGIVGLECNVFYEFLYVDYNDVNLLSWDKITEALETQMPKYFEEHKANYSTVTFNMVELSYYIIQDDTDEGKYIYTPVWIFASIDNDMLKYDYTYTPEQLFILNAVSGEYVDLK